MLFACINVHSEKRKKEVQMTTFTFHDLDINPKIKKAIDDLKYETMTPIQEKAIPIVLAGKDLLGMAQTGTGKTAAFAVPLLNKIDATSKVVQALVLCPTRELAIQVTREMKKMYKHLEGIKAVAVYGGQSYDIQINALKSNPQIVIGTPGRIIDLIDRSLLKFQYIDTLVLDEADEMLKMGFQEELETILEKTPKTRQTLMFSATLPKAILSTANKYLNEYERIEIESTHMTVDTIEQSYFLVKEAQKMDLFIRLFDFHKLNSAILFLNTKKGVDDLAVALQSSSYTTAGLHGDLKQSQRDRVMESFRNRHIQVLLATDVAARGLDIDDVDGVFNYDLPQEEEIYVHRIGRTGRAGKSGKSFTFVTKGQMYHLHSIERLINQSIPKGYIPTIEEVKDLEKFKHYDSIKERLLLKRDATVHPVVDKLLEEGYEKEAIINALLSLLSKEDKKGYNEIEFVEDRPKRDYGKTSTKGSFSKGASVRPDRQRIRNTSEVVQPRKPFEDGFKKDKDFKKERVDYKKEKPNRDLGYKVTNKEPKSDLKGFVFIETVGKTDTTVGTVLSALKRNKINHRDIGAIDIRKNGILVELPFEQALKIASKGTIQLNQMERTVKLSK